MRAASKSSSDDGGCSGDFLGRLFVALSGRSSLGDAQGIRRGRAAPAAKKKSKKIGGKRDRLCNCKSEVEIEPAVIILQLKVRLPTLEIFQSSFQSSHSNNAYASSCDAQVFQQQDRKQLSSLLQSLEVH